jgi:hypothetical protein
MGGIDAEDLLEVLDRLLNPALVHEGDSQVHAGLNETDRIGRMVPEGRRAKPRRESIPRFKDRDFPFDLIDCAPARYTSYGTQALHPISIALVIHSGLCSGGDGM